MELTLHWGTEGRVNEKNRCFKSDGDTCRGKGVLVRSALQGVDVWRLREGLASVPWPRGRPGRGTASVGLRHVGHGLPGSLGGIQT